MFIKRSFDLFSSFMALVIISPLIIIISIAIKISSRGPILFKQVRIGKNEIPFKILKFRTMIVDAEKKGLQITIGERDPRVTKIGYYLRKYKLDELPQLWNVLVGEMSVVGPRPEVPKYVNLYTHAQKKVFEVRPGITDMASIQFRDENELLRQYDDPEKAYIEKIMPQKLDLNLKYINDRSFFIDLKIIFKTLSII